MPFGLTAALENNQPPEVYSGQIGNIFTVIAVLAVIVILIVLLIRFLGNRNHAMSRHRSIRTFGAVGLGPNKSVQVLEIGGNIYVVGVGEDVTMLDKITDPEEIAQLIRSFEEASPDYSRLTSVVSSFTARFRKEEPPVEEEIDEAAFHEVFESKLRKLPNRKQQVKAILQEDQSTDRLGDS
ncbi:flagellar biosynthetic protein FliO [Paenibacillus pinistramenti]|uniref:flagellar biosynthetic protein FliO n=1 Tax=Paenibacillus pinistramenti TaxID=1768003 RepID=UPI0011084495|nr:flagellar biosynthetic protein FliO [Paenibacillus pinistramenti]